MAIFEIKKRIYIFGILCQKKISISSLLIFSVLFVLIFSSSSRQESEITLNKISFFDKQKQSNFGALQQWEASNQEQGGPNTFVTINYDKCIPVQQCKFEDCNIEGSFDGKGNYCLPVDYSKIGDWAPDMSFELFGVSIVKNPSVYSAPVEHAQASARLPDKNGNAYFMFSNSQNYFGFIWVVEVQGIDVGQPQHLNSSMPAKVVWWEKLNKCNSITQCDDQYNQGNFNHPARISRDGSVVAIAFQNYSFTLQGKISLAELSDVFKNTVITVPELLATSTLPIYPAIRSADAVAFYDVSDPYKPQFKRKLIGNRADLWGGNPPGRDISEVAIAKVGSYYHMNVGGTVYNYNNEGRNKLFGNNYRLTLPYVTESLVPLMGDISAANFSHINNGGESYPLSISLITKPGYFNSDGYRQYGLTLQLITSQLNYDNSARHTIDESTQSTFLENEKIFSVNQMLTGSQIKNQNASEGQQLSDLIWMSEACERAWGFQVLENGGYNVICHDADPKGSAGSSVGRFLVRGVSPANNLVSDNHRFL